MPLTSCGCRGNSVGWCSAGTVGWAGYIGKFCGQCAVSVRGAETLRHPFLLDARGGGNQS